MTTHEETAMIRDTVARFVDRELIPLEPHYLKSKSSGGYDGLTDEQRQRLRTVSKDLGLWGLDAPEDLGGHDLPTRTMAAVHEDYIEIADCGEPDRCLRATRESRPVVADADALG